MVKLEEVEEIIELQEENFEKVEVDHSDESTLISEIRSLPDFPLARRYREDGISLSELGKEFGISKQAVHKRIKRFDENARLVESRMHGRASSDPSLSDAHISDELWNCIEPLLRSPTPVAKRGRPRMGDHEVLTAIVYKFQHACSWNSLPAALGKSTTVYRRYRRLVETGIFERLTCAGLLETTGAQRRSV